LLVREEEEEEEEGDDGWPLIEKEGCMVFAF
jgi:hypothetical protein